MKKEIKNLGQGDSFRFHETIPHMEEKFLGTALVGFVFLGIPSDNSNLKVGAILSGDFSKVPILAATNIFLAGVECYIKQADSKEKEILIDMVEKAMKKLK